MALGFFAKRRKGLPAVFVACPVCGKDVPSTGLDIHLDSVCLAASASAQADIPLLHKPPTASASAPIVTQPIEHRNTAASAPDVRQHKDPVDAITSAVSVQEPARLTGSHADTSGQEAWQTSNGSGREQYQMEPVVQQAANTTAVLCDTTDIPKEQSSLPRPTDDSARRTGVLTCVKSGAVVLLPPGSASVASGVGQGHVMAASTVSTQPPLAVVQHIQTLSGQHQPHPQRQQPTEHSQQQQDGMKKEAVQQQQQVHKAGVDHALTASQELSANQELPRAQQQPQQQQQQEELKKEAVRQPLYGQPANQQEQVRNEDTRSSIASRMWAALGVLRSPLSRTAPNSRQDNSHTQNQRAAAVPLPGSLPAGCVDAAPMGHTCNASSISPLQPPTATMQLVPGQAPGQYLLLNFITADEEVAVCAMADGSHPPWKDSRFNGSYRGKAWGVTHDLRARTVSPARVPLPPVLQAIIQRMPVAAPQLLGNFTPNEANAIDYAKGRSWLTPHVDDRQLSTDIICNLSLAGRVVMTLEKQRGPPHKVRIPVTSYKVRVLLPPRSLQILTKEARYSYTHAIYKEDILDDRRISITFRHSPLTKQA